MRRDYTITVKVVDRDTMSAEVTAHDFDRKGVRETRVPSDYGVAKIPLKDLPTPIAALEEFARAANPDYFVTHPRAQYSAAADAGDTLDGRLRAIEAVENRGKGETEPNPASVERFRKFWASNSNLFLPELFSSKDGTIRARWMDGHDKTLWINFPITGPLGWSASLPRGNASGLRRLNARSPDDQDIIPLATLLGIRCGG